MRCVLSASEMGATGRVQSRTGHSSRCSLSRPNVRRFVERHHDAVLPPFTAMTWPVMNEALAEATKTMASAISSGLPARFSGTHTADSREIYFHRNSALDDAFSSSASAVQVPHGGDSARPCRVPALCGSIYGSIAGASPRRRRPAWRGAPGASRAHSPDVVSFDLGPDLVDPALDADLLAGDG